MISSHICAVICFLYYNKFLLRMESCFIIYFLVLTFIVTVVGCYADGAG